MPAMTSSTRGTRAPRTGMSSVTSGSTFNLSTKEPKKSSGVTWRGTTHTVSISEPGSLTPRR